MGSRTVRPFAAAVIAGMLAAACGSSAPSTSPVASAQPSPSPSVHLTEPATVEQVIRAMAIAGLKVVPNNATAGRDGEPVKAVNATLDGWPLVVAQYTSASALRKVAKFNPSKGPAVGDATYTIVGLNILIAYGPQIHDRRAPRPEARFRTSALRIVEVLDPLLGPLQQVTVDPLPLPSRPAASAAASASAPAPSAAKPPKASPSS